MKFTTLKKCFLPLAVAGTILFSGSSVFGQSENKIVVVDSRARRDGDFIEQVGTYNPMAEGENYTLNLESVDKWIANGAQPSETVASIIKKVRAAKA